MCGQVWAVVWGEQVEPRKWVNTVTCRYQGQGIHSLPNLVVLSTLSKSRSEIQSIYNKMRFIQMICYL